jgi:hypothetical protein
MRLLDYMSRERFPRTSQSGLSAKDQLMIDAYNYDELKDYLEQGNTPSPEQAEAWAELEEKMKFNKQLAAELAERGE